MESNSSQLPLPPEKIPLTFNLMLLGDFGAGKTSVGVRYFTDDFQPVWTTIGCEYREKSLDYEGRPINLRLWDPAGTERFRPMPANYYRNAHGIFLLYDITKRLSFEGIDKYMKYIKEYAWPECQLILFGNKVDMEEARIVSFAEGSELASKLGVAFFEGSAKIGLGVKEAFSALLGLMAMIANEGEKIDDWKAVKLKTAASVEQGRSKCF